MLPVFGRIMGNNMRLANCTPEVKKHQEAMMEAKKMGDTVGMARHTKAMQATYKANNCSPFTSLGMVFLQAPVFMSFFFGLRALANHPIPAMETGGAMWFSDLTVHDPYYVLPVVSAASMLAVIELGADGGAMSGKIKFFFRCFCPIVLVATHSFPAAVFCYWTTSNTFSIAQSYLLKAAPVRAVFNIPEKIVHAGAVAEPEFDLKKAWQGVKDGMQAQEDAQKAAAATVQSEAVKRLHAQKRQRRKQRRA